MKFFLKFGLIFTLAILQTSCGFKISSNGANSDDVISGIISPLLGSIASDNSSSYFLQSANATACADPVFVKLFAIKSDGSIDESNPITSQQIGADARYLFDVKSLGISQPTNNVEFVVKAEGCNGDIYKRPVTGFDSNQNLDAKSTVVAEVVNANSLLNKTLNEVSRTQVELLINSISGNSTSAALASLTTQLSASNQFIEIFGTSPSVIQNARPEVNLNVPNKSINELLISTFQATAFHVDPTYSLAYVWKLNGVVKSTNSTWSYIPTANESGKHSIDLYVGKDNGSGEIDLTKPYYAKNISINVNNDVLPTPPNISLNFGNPTPVNSNTVLVDLVTGVSLAHCATFTHLAFTDTPTPPGVSQFNIDCTSSGTQTQSVTFSSGDGNKTLYLWAIDNEGNISNAKTVSLILDTQPPMANLLALPNIIKGGVNQVISFSANDAGVGLSTLDLYFSTNNGVSYSLLSNVSTTASTYNWIVPSLDTSSAKIRLVATDLTTSATTRYSNTFTIDSTTPTALAIARTSAAISNSTSVAISATCNVDYDKVFYSQTSTAPAASDANWEICNATKNFTVNTGEGLKTIYAFTKDVAGNISTSSNVTMTLDTTPPIAPVANLASASISSSSTVTFTITDCLDRPSVLVSESMIAPLTTDPAWQTCSTSAGAIAHTLVGPVLQGTHNLYVYAKDAIGNISSSTSASMIYDTTNPTLTLSTALGALYKGGNTIALSFAGSDTNGLSSLRLYYALDGSTYSLANNLATSATSYTWTIPSDNTSTAKLKLVAIDNTITANSTTVFSSTFTIDSTAPTAPTIARGSVQYSTSNSVTINTTCNVDYFQILYTETSSIPSLANPNWEFCGATKSYTTSTGDGLKNIYAFTRDAAGNISASSNINMTFDTTLPTLTLSSMNAGGYFQGGSSQNITWTASDVNLTSTPISISYSTDGATYTAIVSNTANSGTYSWSLPAINSATVTLRISATDLAGNIRTTTSSSFVIDSIAPTISSFTLANGTASVALPSVSVQVSASDSSSGNYRMRLSESSTYVNNNWQTYSSTGATFTLSSTNGAKTVYIWVQDNVGNISSSTSANISLDFGNPPTVAISQPDGSSSYTSGQSIPISFSCTGTNGLTSNPITISYTIDNGITFNSIASNLAYSSGTQTYNWTFPAGITQPVRIRVDCSSSAGVVSNSLSQFFNTGGWKIFIGNPTYGIQNVNANVADVSGSNVHLYGDTYGNIYYQKNSAIMKIDKTTGLVTTFAGNPNSSGCSLSNGVNAGSVNMGTPHMLGFDSPALTGLLVGQNCAGSVRVFRIDVDTSIVTLVATLDSNANITSAFLTNNFYLIFIGTSNNIFTLNLSSAGNNPVNIATTTTSQHLMASPDGNTIWVSDYNNGGGSTQKLTGDITSGNSYSVNTVASSSNYASVNHCIAVPFDSRYIYCQNRDNFPTGRQVYVFDTQTETFPTAGVVSYPGNDDSGNISIGFMKDKLLVRYLDQIYTSIPVIGGTWTHTTIAGQPKTIYGNGSNPLSSVGLSGAFGVDYNALTQVLYVTYNQSSLRKIDLSTTPPTISTLFGPNSYSTGSNRLNPSTNKMASYYSCSYQFINSLLINSTSVTATTPYLTGSPGCGNTTNASSFPVPDGASATSTSSGSFYFRNTGGIGYINNNNFVMHSNNKVYFFGQKTSDNSSPMIYSSNQTIINQIAGLSGAAPGYFSGDSGNFSLGARLKDVTMMLEIKSGSYSGDLLIIDNNFLRRISITTENSGPRIYDVLDLTTITGYIPGTVMLDAYYDSSSETSGLGSGYLYYVTASTLHKLNPQTLQDTQYTFNGTTLSGSMRITKVPTGILVTQPALNRILLVPL